MGRRSTALLLLLHLDSTPVQLTVGTIQNVHTEEWEAAGEVPKAMYLKCAADGLLVPIAAGRQIPEDWRGYPIVGGIKPEEWDGFHDFVLWDELYRGGAISSIFVGLVSLPPLLVSQEACLDSPDGVIDGCMAC